MLKAILAAIVLIVAGFAAYVALQPSLGVVERSAVLQAPAEAVFANINDLHRMQTWSPWAKLDPNIKMTYTGPEVGKGSVMSWTGNNEVGEGRMEIVDSVPDQSVKLKLDFIKPFSSTSTSSFTLHPEGSGTRVTWNMTGERPFLMRAICIAMGADKMMREMFDKGLADLGRISSSKP